MKPRIKEIRKSKGMTQKFAAEQLGMTYQRLSEFERGIAYPRIDRAQEIADFLKVTLNDLYET